jgi:imidazole glycerol-phosphate synthase subunit HisH
MKIGVVNYGAGNLRSVETALQYLHAPYTVTADPQELLKTDRIIFPGVGEANAAMAELRRSGMDEAIREVFDRGALILGICIGCQVVLDYSEESCTECLSLLPGRVVRFSSELQDKSGTQLKVPHMGWNEVMHRKEHWIFKGIPTTGTFYFVHSYYPKPAEEKHILAETEYGVSFVSAFADENLIAVQFHPEKSGEAGLKLLTNFITET